MGFIAGTYTVTWNSLTLGQFEDGFEFTEPGVGDSEDIRGDYFGQGADQDAVLLGGNCFIQGIMLEANAAALRNLLSKDGVSGRAFVPGTLISSLWQPLVLTRYGDGSIVTATPATRTCARTHLVRSQQITYALKNKLRRVPIRFQVFPYVSGSNILYWVDS
mgnify:CR=1 FL=1